jgi:hypothetical protein
MAPSALTAGDRFTVVGVPAWTVHAVLVRCRLNRLSHIDIRTGEQIWRYEHGHPDSLIHVDVNKLGNIPDGGGWRFVGRARGKKNRTPTAGVHRDHRYQPMLGHAYVHTVSDDHSRVAYAEIHEDESAQTAIGVLRRTMGWLGTPGITVERVLSRNYTNELTRRSAPPPWLHTYNTPTRFPTQVVQCKTTRLGARTAIRFASSR